MAPYDSFATFGRATRSRVNDCHTTRYDLMSCHQYPTRACVAGNGEVRSPWNNVASSLSGWQLNREGRLRRPVPGRRELGSGSTVNIRESLINVVSSNKPKVLTGLNQKVRGRAQELPNLLSQATAPPAQRRDLHYYRLSISRMSLTRNVVSPSVSPADARRNWGRTVVRPTNGSAGRGRRRKQTPSCNEADRGVALLRKGADFRLVFLHERLWPTDQEGKADDGRSSSFHWCVLPRGGRLGRHRLAGSQAHRASAPSAYREGDAANIAVS